ncbi:MAG: hypothetical protein U0441_22075 [Polyangiaceae bacterium]
MNKLFAIGGLLLAAGLCGCVGTTGGEIVTFDAVAAGPEDAVAGQPYSFVTSRGYKVTLTRAKVHVGAVYLNKSRPSSVASDTSCQLPGIYVAEVTSGVDVDLLSGAPQPFPGQGFATTEHASTAEVWLFGDDINEPSDDTVILDVAGTAEKDGETVAFDGAIHIGQNRVIAAPSIATPGANPICKQRIVSPIPVDLTARKGKRLVLRIDPRGLFANAEISKLEEVQEDPPLSRFRDDDGDQPSRALYSGLRASVGTYSVTWE